MMLLIGLLLLIPTILLIVAYNNLKTKRNKKIIINISLILMSIIYMFFALIINQEPFAFEINNIFDYFIKAAVIYVFSPFLWIITVFFFKRMFKVLFINKKARINNDKEFKYYRDKLDKISPNLILFTSKHNVDIRKSVSSTILKLKVSGYLVESRKKLKQTDKDISDLSESEKIIIDLINGKPFNETTYKKVIEKEAVYKKYVTHNKYGVAGRVIKIILLIALCTVFFKQSMKLDKYVSFNYHIVNVVDNNIAYVRFRDHSDIAEIKEMVKDESHFYHKRVSIFGNDIRIPEKTLVEAKRLEYPLVRKAVLLNVLVLLSIIFCIMWAVFTTYMVIIELIHLKKNYRTTIKGKNLLTNVYALKNFLEDFSIIKKRKEIDEVKLWDYYLIYAVALGLNEEIEDKVIEKYL